MEASNYCMIVGSNPAAGGRNTQNYKKTARSPNLKNDHTVPVQPWSTLVDGGEEQ